MRAYTCTKCEHPMKPVLGEGDDPKVLAYLCHRCFLPHLPDGTLATNEVLQKRRGKTLNAELSPKGKSLNADKG